jgi:hypothetical protein
LELEQGGSEANGFWGRIAVLGNREPFEVPQCHCLKGILEMDIETDKVIHRLAVSSRNP